MGGADLRSALERHPIRVLTSGLHGVVLPICLDKNAEEAEARTQDRTEPQFSLHTPERHILGERSPVRPHAESPECEFRRDSLERKTEHAGSLVAPPRFAGVGVVPNGARVGLRFEHISVQAGAAVPGNLGAGIASFQVMFRRMLAQSAASLPLAACSLCMDGIPFGQSGAACGSVAPLCRPGCLRDLLHCRVG